MAITVSAGLMRDSTYKTYVRRLYVRTVKEDAAVISVYRVNLNFTKVAIELTLIVVHDSVCCIFTYLYYSANGLIHVLLRNMTLVSY